MRGASIFQDYLAMEIDGAPGFRPRFFVPGMYKYDRKRMKAEMLIQSTVGIIQTADWTTLNKNNRKFDQIRVLSYWWLTNDIDGRFDYRPPYEPADYEKRQLLPGTTQPFETVVRKRPKFYPMVRVIAEDESFVVLKSSGITILPVGDQLYYHIDVDYGELKLDKNRGYCPISGNYRGGYTGFFQDVDFVVQRVEWINSVWMPIEWTLRAYWQGSHRPEDSLDIRHLVDLNSVEVLDSPRETPLKNAKAIGNADTNRWEVRDSELEYLSTRPVD